MTAELNSDFLLVIDGEDAKRRLFELKEGLKADKIIPYLGPGLMRCSGSPLAAPDRPEEVAKALHERSPAPSKIRTNMWSVAQHIEQRRHRRTLQAWMAEIFAAKPQPGPIQKFLATLPLSLIIDSWYDGAMRAALIEADRTGVKDIQGVTRSGEFRDIWTKTYDLAGAEIAPDTKARSILYELHGSAQPAGNFLVADSDYVEVLTEIDIQTPIPDEVKELRQTRGFLFLGCRFDDQMLRTYARQLMKRSSHSHFAVIDVASLTKNERRFLALQGIVAIDVSLETVASIFSH